MMKPLRLLIVEDSEDDALLIVRQLKEGGFAPDFRRVDGAAALREALGSRTWDVILSDYRMPGFDGLESLKIARELAHDVPFIVVSGTIGEETAVTMMKAGAADYLLKDALGRLVPAVERELREAAVRRDRRAQEVALRESEAGYRFLFDASTDGILIIGLDGRLLDANRTAYERLGYTREELLAMGIGELDHPDFAAHIPDRMQQLSEKGSLVFESAHVRKDGSTMPVEISSRLLDYRGRRVYFSIVRDITERKKTETLLRNTNQTLQALIRHSPLAVVCTDRQGNISVWNAAAEKMFGWSEQEVLGRQNPIIPETKREEYRNLQEQVRSGKPYHAKELQRKRNDGSLIYLNASSSAVYADNGEIIALIGMFEDMTDRKAAEEALRARERQLAESQRIAHIGSWEHNLTTGQVNWSDELFRLVGLDPAKDPADFSRFLEKIHPDDRPALQRAIDETVQTGKPFSIEYRILLSDGRARTVHAQAELKHDVAGIQNILSGTAQDITERKRAEAELAERGAMLQQIMDTANVTICIVDMSGRIIHANRRMCEMFGRPMDDLVGRAYVDLVHPDERETGRRNMIALIEKRISFVDLERRYIRKDNSEFWGHLVCQRFLDARGNELGLLGVIADVTEHRRAEERIRHNEQFIRGVLDTVDEGFIVIDRDYRILIANKAYCGQAGQACDDIIGKHCYRISHRTDKPCYEQGEECAVRSVFESGEPHTVSHKHTDADGHVVYVETKAYPMKDDAGRVVSAIETVSNITEKHLLEEERLKSQKLEAIGTLAGGIAHDFNNLLQGVFGYISMAKLHLDPKSSAVTMLGQAEKALNLSVGLTSQLLTFSKGGKPVKKRLDLRPVIENAVKFALSGSRLDYRIGIEDALAAVEADESQIAQVIQNIVLNANQAMPLGGMISIEARNVRAPQPDLPQGLAGGAYVAVSVRDSGIGIPDNYLPRIFDPYFTTKEKGSGLGLATSYSIVRNHGGLIDVESEVGQGSVFTIYLPAASGVRAVAPRQQAATTGRKGKILVMDDEEIVRMVTGEILRSLGHAADFAEHGAAAVEMYRQAREAGSPYDLVILDLTVRGGMGGEETMKQLRAIDPEVKAVVASGYSENGVVSDYREHGFKAFLKKPFELNDLEQMLNELLA